MTFTTKVIFVRQQSHICQAAKSYLSGSRCSDINTHALAHCRAHTHTCTHTHTRMHARMHTRTDRQAHTDARTHTYTCLHSLPSHPCSSVALRQSFSPSHLQLTGIQDLSAHSNSVFLLQTGNKDNAKQMYVRRGSYTVSLASRSALSTGPCSRCPNVGRDYRKVVYKSRS